MTQEASKESIWTPANVVTIIRILGVPVFFIALLSPWPQWFPQVPELEAWKPWVAVFLFVLLACTDSLDGYLARSRDEVTTFGKFVDPLADKILVAAALLSMIELGIIPSWVALVILTREFIVSGLRMVAAADGTVIAASWYGKAKTVTQIFAIILFLVKDICLEGANTPDSPLYIVAWVVMVAALVLTIVSMVDYFIKCMPLLGLGKGKGADADGKTRGRGAGDDVASVSARDGSDGMTDVQKRGIAPVCVGPAATEAPDDAELEELAGRLIAAAREKHLTVATAESLTGGMIGQYLTSVPGSSSVVQGGVISYTFDVKERVLGVSGEVLAREGAVCREVAEQMALGSRSQTGADFAVSVTGIAGPGGEEPGKPVGTVWQGVATPDGVSSKECHFSGSRKDVRMSTTKSALCTLLDLVENA